MGQKIVVGVPFDKGLRNDVTPFNVDNNSFPNLVNAYQFRGRIKRKRGTAFLNRLTRNLYTQALGMTDGTGAFSGNIISLLSLQSTSQLVPGSIAVTIGSQTFLDANSDGIELQQTGVGYITAITGITLPTSTSSLISLADPNYIPGMVVYISGVTGMTAINGSYYTITAVNAGVTITVTTPTNSTWGAYSAGGVAKRVAGSINYASSVLTLQTVPALLTTAVSVALAYYPGLPVLGLEPFVGDASDFLQEVGFDTTYAYDISINVPFNVHSVSFYNNPPTSGTYTQKTTWTPLNWNLKDYQQVWTTNYQGAMWTVPGISDPYVTTNVGMQFKLIGATTVLSGTTASLAITAHGLVVGDFVFINEVDVVTGINFQTGYVTTVTNANLVTITFPNATLAAGPGTTGMAQYLTNNSDSTKDCIRWYNGDPVNSVAAGTFLPNKGWVNFCPPLVASEIGTYSIGGLPAGTYYLVGARMVVPYKDRLLFFGPLVQTSSTGPFYLQDTVIYSQNGTPYYTASFPYSTVNPALSALATVSFTPQIIPTNQTSDVRSWIENATGYGGFISAGYARPITSVSINEDVLIIGLSDRQARLAFTGNDIVPFNFYIINSELGSESTFSTVTLDRGVLSVGGRGIILTSQISSQRVDLEIPDEVFRIKLTDQGTRRIAAQRDFINEWVYFTYPSDIWASKFPTRTLQYNYRENTWAIFNETYTTYGLFRQKTGYTWATIGSRFPTWASWNEPWSSGSSTLLQPQVIAGNQQGFILFRDDGTNESRSLFISGIIGSTITCPNHSLNEGDYIVIENCLGTIGAEVNGNIFSVKLLAITDVNYSNKFILNPTIGSGTYLGNGTIKRMYVPFIQTKQFPVAWEMSRKTRLGAQKYLLTKTSRGSCTLYIYLSQVASTPFNFGPILPDILSVNDTLIYSSLLYTCPESTNLGLTPANINLQMLTGNQQSQIWHRVNTSLIGDTVQVAITFNDDQMRDTDFKQQFAELELHGMILDCYPSQVLA